MHKQANRFYQTDDKILILSATISQTANIIRDTFSQTESKCIFDIKLKPIFQTIVENQYNLEQKNANNRTLDIT